MNSYFVSVTWAPRLFWTISYHVSINLQGQKYCSICPLCHYCEGTSARSHVNAAAVSRHHMLPPTNRLQSHLTVNYYLCDLCHLPLTMLWLLIHHKAMIVYTVGQSIVVYQIGSRRQIVLIYRWYLNKCSLGSERILVPTIINHHLKQLIVII